MSSTNGSSGVQTPTLFNVTFGLVLISVAFGILTYLFEYLSGFEISGSGILTTILPAIIVGYFFGYKSGELLPSKIRWSAILLWTLVSIILFCIISVAMEVSLMELFGGLGGINFVLVGILAVSVIISYFALKHGEKMGIKAHAKYNKI